MPFIRPKKIVFCNNKGGVGKTTLLFNIASEMSKQGLRVAMVDLDPQTNLTMNVMGENRIEDLFNGKVNSIYDVLKDIEAGTGDINTSIKPFVISDNFYLIPGSLEMSKFEGSTLSVDFATTSSGSERGFRTVSAINRYLDKIGLDYKIDLFLIDTSPTLGVLNKIAILGSDFFVVPVNPNIFSVQGVENIGKVFFDWKEQWRNIQEYSFVKEKIPANLVLKASPIFLGWIFNNYRPYNKNPLKLQDFYKDKLSKVITESLSKTLTRNGLYETTQKEIGKIQEFGGLFQRSHEQVLAVVNMQNENLKDLPPGSKETFVHVKKEIEDVTSEIVRLAEKYQNS